MSSRNMLEIYDALRKMTEEDRVDFTSFVDANPINLMRSFKMKMKRCNR